MLTAGCSETEDAARGGVGRLWWQEARRGAGERSGGRKRGGASQSSTEEESIAPTKRRNAESAGRGAQASTGVNISRAAGRD